MKQCFNPSCRAAFPSETDRTVCPFCGSPLMENITWYKEVSARVYTGREDYRNDAGGQEPPKGGEVRADDSAGTDRRGGKNQSTMGHVRFAVEHAIWAIISMIWYKSVLFRRLEGCSAHDSRLILWVLIVLCSGIGICMAIHRRRNGTSVFVNLITAYGLYTTLAYLPVKKRFIMAVLSAAAVVSVLYALLVMCGRVRNKRKFKKIIRRRAGRAISAAQVLFAVGFGLIMTSMGINTLFGSTLVTAAVAPATPSTVEEQTLNNHMDTMALLQSGSWSGLTLQERLDVLQTAANIEQRYLGLPDGMTVGAADLEEGVLGYYSDAAHEIVISIDHLQDDSSWDVLNTVCHEVYHSYQHRVVDAWLDADEAIRGLRMFKKAGAYAEEFQDYISGNEDFCSYYNQDCEIDARDYAEEAVNDYYGRIRNYVTGEA